MLQVKMAETKVESRYFFFFHFDCNALLDDTMSMCAHARTHEHMHTRMHAHRPRAHNNNKSRKINLSEWRKFAGR